MEVPLVDSLQYSRINRALAKGQAAMSAGSNPSVESAISLSHSRRQVVKYRNAIFEELKGGSRKPSAKLIEAIVGLAEAMNSTAQTVSKTRKEAEIAIDVLNQVDKILSNDPFTDAMKKRIDKSITNYIHLKDEEVIHCIKNIPSGDQLIGKEHIGSKDDIDNREFPEEKPTWAHSDSDPLDPIRISTTVEEFIDKRKDRLKELYEIMKEDEVHALLAKGQTHYINTSSIDEVADILLQNLKVWRKKNMALSGEEAFKKEKSLVRLLIEARKKLKTFSEHYKNYYEALYSEVSSVDPEAVVPNKAPKVLEELRSSLLGVGNVEELYEVKKSQLNDPLLTIEVLLPMQEVGHRQGGEEVHEEEAEAQRLLHGDILNSGSVLADAVGRREEVYAGDGVWNGCYGQPATEGAAEESAGPQTS